LWRAYQKEWGKHLILVEADETSGDVVRVECLNGIIDPGRGGGGGDVGEGNGEKNDVELRRLCEQNKNWNMPGGAVYVT